MGHVTPPRPVVLAVCGLKAEARIAAGLGVASLACGGDAPTLARRLPQECERLRPVGLMSFGIAGGLDPRLTTGDVLIGSTVIAEEAHYECDVAWRRVLVRSLAGAVVGPLAAGDHALATPADKSGLYRRTLARAVDMESQHVARFASAHGLPFIALRVIADPADRALPGAALVGLQPDGRAAILKVILALMKTPAELPALLQVAHDSRQALARLLSSRLCLGPGLGFPDFGKLVLDMA